MIRYCEIDASRRSQVDNFFCLSRVSALSLSSNSFKTNNHGEARRDGEAKVSRLEGSSQPVVSWVSGSTKTTTSKARLGPRHSGSRMMG